MEILLYIIIGLSLLVLSAAWTTRWGAPWVPSSLDSVHEMLRLAEVKPGELVYDLGCGDGRIIITAALHYDARAVGIELDPLRWLWCQLVITVLGLRGKVKVILGDIFKQDLSPANVVTCYLLPKAYRRLEGKLLQELDPGTRVVSNTFLFHQLMPVKQMGKIRLYQASPEHTLEGLIRSGEITRSRR